MTIAGAEERAFLTARRERNKLKRGEGKGGGVSTRARRLGRERRRETRGRKAGVFRESHSNLGHQTK